MKDGPDDVLHVVSLLGEPDNIAGKTVNRVMTENGPKHLETPQRDVVDT